MSEQEELPRFDKSGLKEACQRGLAIGRTHQEFDLQLLLDMLLEIERLEELVHAQPAEDERQKLLEILVGELANAIAEGYRPNLVDMAEAHRILKLSVQPAASTPTDETCHYPDWEGGIEQGQHRWDKNGFCNICGIKKPAAVSTEAQDERKQQ